MRHRAGRTCNAGRAQAGPVARPERPKPQKQPHVERCYDCDAHITPDRGLHAPEWHARLEWLVSRHQQGIGPYLTNLIQDADEHENSPAGVAHPIKLNLVVPVVEYLLLQFVTRRFDRFEVYIASMSVPRDESAERKPHNDDDQGADGKESKR